MPTDLAVSVCEVLGKATGFTFKILPPGNSAHERITLDTSLPFSGNPSEWQAFHNALEGKGLCWRNDVVCVSESLSSSPARIMLKLNPPERAIQEEVKGR